MPRPDQKHHYLPVFYLKQWRAADGRICEYSRPHGTVKPRPTYPDGAGYVRGLYRIDGLPPETMNVIETQFLMPTDGLASDALKALVAGREFAKPTQMRHSWTRFILSLMLRYPEAIDAMKRRLRENVQKVYAANRKEADPATFEEYEAQNGTDEMARLHGKLLMDLMQDSRMGRLIFGMHWGVISFSRSEHTLLTSDRPVISNVFPLSANHVCLPIGPERMFFACATEEAEKEMQRLDPRTIMRLMNDEIAKRALRYVYANNDRQLRFVENRLGRTKQKSVPFL
jgi:hypothetical protein